MEMMTGNVLRSVSSHHLKNIHHGEIIDVDESRKFYRPAKNSLKNTNCVAQAAQFGVVDSSRINALKEDILYFRDMLEQMIRQQTEKTDCRDSILKSCNSLLGNNYRKMHKKYLDLLNKTQAHEAEMHLRVLESELASLLKNKSFDVAMERVSWAA
jgi:hypothetical protein